MAQKRAPRGRKARRQLAPHEKKKVKRREGIERPWNGNEWSTPRMRSFVMSALRRAMWPQRHKAIAKAFVKKGPNPATGRECKLHECEHCHRLFPQGDMHADHTEPVIPLEADWAQSPTNFLGYDWNLVISRLYVEVDGYTILCHECHGKVTHQERVVRTALKEEANNPSEEDDQPTLL